MKNISVHLPSMDVTISPTYFAGMACHWLWVYNVMFVAYRLSIVDGNLFAEADQRVVTIAVFCGMLLVSLVAALPFTREGWPPPVGFLWAVAAVGSCATVACLGIVDLPSWACFASGLVAGMASSCLFLCWLPLLGSLGEAPATANIGLAFVCALFLYFGLFYSDNVILALVCGIAVLCLETAFLQIALGRGKGTGVERGGPLCKSPTMSMGAYISQQQVFRVVKGAIVLLCFGFAESIMRELALVSLLPIDGSWSLSMALALACLCSGALICLALVAPSQRDELTARGGFARFGNALLLVGIAVALLALMPVDDRGLYIVVSCGVYVFYETYLWSVVVQLVANAPFSRRQMIGAVVLLLFVGQFITPIANEFIVNGAASDMVPMGAIAEPVVVMLALLASLVLMMTGCTIGDIIAPVKSPQSDAGARERRVQAVCKRYMLTERESAVLDMLMQGRSLGKISEVFCVSENTTKTHVKNIYRKTGVHSKQQLIDLVEGEDG